MKKITLFTLIATLGGFVHAQTTWTIDKSHTDIGFTVTHMVISEVYGEFKEFDGTVTSESEDFNGATVEFAAKTGSINTDNERRDNHLKSDDFFNAESFPEITFNGKIVNEDGKYYLDGDFTMRDVTKEVRFDVRFNGTIPARRGLKAGFKVTGAVNRFEYGLKWDRTVETGGLVVGEEVMISCNVELNEKTEG